MLAAVFRIGLEAKRVAYVADFAAGRRWASVIIAVPSFAGAAQDEEENKDQNLLRHLFCFVLFRTWFGKRQRRL